MNKKKGFTLIELLLVIVLVISLLGLAIFNVTKITKKQKENQYEKVKDTVVTAAENYFDVNEYYFEMLEDGASSIISVDELVKYDYLNALTDPRTGKKLNKCDRVQVTKSDGIYNFEYVTSNDSDCERKTPNMVIIEPGAPKINIEEIGTSGDNEWYTSSVKIKVTGENEGNGDVVEIGKCSDVECISTIPFSTSNSYVDEETYKNSTDEVDTWYYVKNSYNKMAIANVSVKVDKDIPTCTLNAEGTKSDEWYTSNVTIKFADKKDIGPSGLSSEYGINQLTIFYNNKKNDLLVNHDTNGETYYGHVKDNAGNTGYCTKDIKISKTGPSCPSNLFTYTDVTAGKNSYCDPSRSTENYHCTSVKVTLNNIPSNWESYTFDGETNTASKTYESAGEHTPVVIAKDKVGRTSSCHADKFIIDKTRPNAVTVTNTPTICQMNYANKPKLDGILKNFNAKSSTCNTKFQYISNNFNGKLSKYEPSGNFYLYLEFKSSDNVGGSGLAKSTSTNYTRIDNWYINYKLFDKDNVETSSCSDINKNYPCSWKQDAKVYDKAGNVSTTFTKTYGGIKY